MSSEQLFATIYVARDALRGDWNWSVLFTKDKKRGSCWSLRNDDGCLATKRAAIADAEAALAELGFEGKVTSYRGG